MPLLYYFISKSWYIFGRSSQTILKEDEFLGNKVCVINLTPGYHFYTYDIFFKKLMKKLLQGKLKRRKDETEGKRREGRE